jgi:endonuclease/exonuclease/phosphatase family metal-dependent hydrolase
VLAVFLKVMTFNLRFDNPEDGVHGWPHRKECVIDVVLQEQPDLLATQEGMPHQIDFLDRGLRGYQAALNWRPPDENSKRQYPTIFYRTERLVLQHGGEFWLSETPSVRFSKSWETAFPRMFTFGRFICRSTGRGIWFGNTHLDHISGLARLRGSELICRWAQDKRRPIVLAGDFNDQPDSEVHRAFIERRFIDPWWAHGAAADDNPSTTHDFNGNPVGGRIDWILVSDAVRVREARILDYAVRCCYPSDHFPYLAAMEIEEDGLERERPKRTADLREVGSDLQQGNDPAAKQEPL